MFSNLAAGVMLLFAAAAAPPDVSNMTPFAARALNCGNYTIEALAYDPDPAKDALVITYSVGGVLIAAHDGRTNMVYVAADRKEYPEAEAAAKYENNLCNLPIPKTA